MKTKERESPIYAVEWPWADFHRATPLLDLRHAALYATPPRIGKARMNARTAGLAAMNTNPADLYGRRHCSSGPAPASSILLLQGIAHEERDPRRSGGLPLPAPVLDADVPDGQVWLDCTDGSKIVMRV